MEKSQLPAAVEIIKQITGASEVKETHISYAVLGDDFVYKIKKPVDFGFLDYKLPKSRRMYCILEKELNERFSKDVYLDVLKIARRSSKEFVLVPVESSLTAIEYVVKMRRIDDKDFLATRINDNLISYDDMVRIGGEVALLFKKLEPAPTDSDSGGFYSAVKFNAEENFSQTEKYKSKFIDGDSYDFIKKASLKFIEKNKSIFEKRAMDGFVKNGHGDLRLEHIYFNTDGSVGLIDCIEFNKRFRYMDSIAEAAFLSMELDFSSKLDLSDAFLQGFLSVFNDDESIKFLNYYRSYLAYVRAKVTCFLLDGKEPEWENYDSKSLEVKRLIDMSAYYAMCMEEINTPLFYGIMGTGKSKNAKEFALRFPVYRINSDEARKKAAGVPVTEKMYLDYGKGVYSKESSITVYRDMALLVEDKGRKGRGCLVDASFIEPEYLSVFHEYKIGRPRFFQFTAPDDVIMGRLKDRLEKDVVSDGRPAIYYEQKKSAKMPIPELMIETTGSVSDNLEKIFKTLINEI